MSKKLNLIVELVQNVAFTILEGTEVIEVLIREKLIDLLKVQNISFEWESYGAIWSECEVLSYVNEGKMENLFTLKDVLSWGMFFKLKTGKIFSWNY